MKKTVKMTSGKGVEKCDGKRCPGATQADGNLGGGLTPQYRGEPSGPVPSAGPPTNWPVYDKV